MVMSPGRRTVSTALRVMGLVCAKDFGRLSLRAQSRTLEPRAVSRKLLTMIIENFLPSGPRVIGLDDTIERRWGPKISACLS